MTRAEPRFLAITGPTASGKTDLSLAIADRIDVEIISMDSRQVYRGMDIGTDKVRELERSRVPHHGLDLVRPDERYSAGHFARDVRTLVNEIERRGRSPLLVGGTGFFLRAVMEPVFAEPPMDEERRRSLRAFLARQPVERLARWVTELDPARARVAVEGGPQRMGRTIEVALLTGRPLSQWHRIAPAEAEGLPGVVVRLDVPREEMDKRIDERVSRMIDEGLVAEVERLLSEGYTADDPGMSGTGYREIIRYLGGDTSLERATDEIRKNTRRYARRQLTWFRNQLPEATAWIDATAPLDEQVREALGAWRAACGTSTPTTHSMR